MTVQEGITNLCDYAFNGCVLLTDVSLPSTLKSIDSRAFAGCESLRGITLPAGLYDIASSAFQDCVALESITLPQGLYAIGPRAFQNCDSLTAIDIPGSVKSLGGWFLSGCDNLRTVTLHPGLETVGQEAFRGLGVESLTLPDTVQTIENSAFEGCGLRSITLSANLKYIGFRAFLDCEQLTALTLPASVEDVAANAFDLSPIRILVVRNPQCRFSYDEHNIAGIAGLFGFGGADVYGYPGSTVQQILERFPDSGYTFKPLYFDDVAPGIWYYDAVSFAREHALFQGVGDRAFAPESAMSRAMVVQVLYNYAGNGAVCPNSFTDVPDSAWYAKAVAWAAREGIVNGVGEGRFAPETSVTREQFAAIMYRFTSWQGIEPAYAIRYLGKAIYHVHAKDTKIDHINTATTGVLDTKHYSDEINRAWVFRTVGYGHNETFWKDLVDNLRLVGYDRVLSIEHEDSLMSIDEGLTKAVEFLKPIIMKDPKPGTMSWA